MRGQTRADPSDWTIAELARRQHGVLSRGQLKALGFGEDAIDGRVRRGRLHQLHRGVYAVGHLNLTRNARFMAAVLACGDEAALSHFTAAVMWGMLSDEGKIHVTAPTCRRRSGLVVHRAALEEGEV